MRAKTFDECLRDVQALRTPPAPPTLTKADRERFDAIVADALRSVNASKATRSAVDDVETRIAQRIDKNPVTVTRAIAMHDVFTADPELYERYQRENTFGRNGQALSADPAFRDVGVGRVTAKSADADAEITRRVQALVSKTSGATFEQALAFVGREDPELLARWQRESYA